MTDLKSGTPTFTVRSEGLPDKGVFNSLTTLVYTIRAMYESIVAAVNSKQDKDAELNIKYYNQNTEPTLGTNENAAFWEDADGGPLYYLVLKESGGTQVKVQLS